MYLKGNQTFHIKIFHIKIFHIKQFHIKQFYIKIFHIKHFHIKQFHIKIFHIKLFHIKIIIDINTDIVAYKTTEHTHMGDANTIKIREVTEKIKKKAFSNPNSQP